MNNKQFYSRVKPGKQKPKQQSTTLLRDIKEEISGEKDIRDVIKDEYENIKTRVNHIAQQWGQKTNLNSLGEIVGSGWNGIVNTVEDDETIISKINRDNYHSLEWLKQGDYQRNAHKALNEVMCTDIELTQRIMIPQVISSSDISMASVSQIIMERIYPLEGQPSLIQCLFGDYNGDFDNKLDKQRGMMLSQDSLMTLLNSFPKTSSQFNTNYETACHDIGVLIASVQYHAKQTGNDLELILGRRTSKSKDYILALIDFDRCLPYDVPDIEEMADALIYLPFYPVEYESVGCEIFKKAYLDTAALVGCKDVAKKILQTARD